MRIDWNPWLFGLAIVVALYPVPVRGHSWYPPRCCSGFDCRPIMQEDVLITPAGFVIKENGETIPFNDNRIQKTPPEGGALYHRCSEGGTPQGRTICLYIPNWGN